MAAFDLLALKGSSLFSALKQKRFKTGPVCGAERFLRLTAIGQRCSYHRVFTLPAVRFIKPANVGQETFGFSPTASCKSASSSAEKDPPRVAGAVAADFVSSFLPFKCLCQRLSHAAAVLFNSNEEKFHREQKIVKAGPCSYLPTSSSEICFAFLPLLTSVRKMSSSFELQRRWRSPVWN